MSTTREETIATLEESKRQNKIMIDNPTTFWASHQMADGVKNAKRRIEALDHALSALRPISREQVEKVWRAHWNESVHLGGFVYCSRCGYNALEANNYTFCPKCGSPFTDEAVEMVMERLEGMDNGTVPCDNA